MISESSDELSSELESEYSELKLTVTGMRSFKGAGEGDIGEYEGLGLRVTGRCVADETEAGVGGADRKRESSEGVSEAALSKNMPLSRVYSSSTCIASSASVKLKNSDSEKPWPSSEWTCGR